MESARAQVDLNRACLRTAVKLLDRLQLRPLDGSAGDDSSHVVARLFIRYSSILLKGLDICQMDTPVGSGFLNEGRERSHFDVLDRLRIMSRTYPRYIA
jgi:hypothetical protein